MSAFELRKGSEAARDYVVTLLAEKGNRSFIIGRFRKHMEGWKNDTLEKFWQFLEDQAQFSVDSVIRPDTVRPLGTILEETGFGTGTSAMENFVHFIEALRIRRNERLDNRSAMDGLKEEFRKQDAINELKEMVNQILEFRAIDRRAYRTAILPKE